MGASLLPPSGFNRGDLCKAGSAPVTAALLVAEKRASERSESHWPLALRLGGAGSRGAEIPRPCRRRGLQSHSAPEPSGSIQRRGPGTAPGRRETGTGRPQETLRRARLRSCTPLSVGGGGCRTGTPRRANFPRQRPADAELERGARPFSRKS